MLRCLRQKHRQTAKEFEKEKITFVWGTRRLMRSFVDKIALSQGWKDNKVDTWTWKDAEKANLFSQKTGHQTSLYEGV